jgi:hypothetical protein
VFSIQLIRLEEEQSVVGISQQRYINANLARTVLDTITRSSLNEPKHVFCFLFKGRDTLIRCTRIQPQRQTCKFMKGGNESEGMQNISS